MCVVGSGLACGHKSMLLFARKFNVVKQEWS